MIPLADVCLCKHPSAGSGLVAPHSNFGPLTTSFQPIFIYTCDTLTSGCAHARLLEVAV